MAIAWIELDVHLCDQRRSIRVKFATEAQAIEYIKRRSHECAFDVPEDVEVPPAVFQALDPMCEHGLSRQLCAGPDHYPADDRWEMKL